MNLEILEKDILELLGLEDLPEDQKRDLLTKMGELIEDRITLRILDFLTEEDRKKMDELLEKGKEKELDEFLKEKVPNLEELVLAEVLSFKEELVSLFKHL